MAKKIIILLGLVIFGVLNFNIWSMEKIRQSAEIVYLKLELVDPRSLMQGDYMRLNYEIPASVRDAINEVAKQRKVRSGKLLIELDDQKIVTVLGLYTGEKLKDNQRLLDFSRTAYGRIKIKPMSYFFQEGTGHIYQDAAYGVYALYGQGGHLLIGLADADQQILTSVEKVSKE